MTKPVAAFMPLKRAVLLSVDGTSIELPEDCAPDAVRFLRGWAMCRRDALRLGAGVTVLTIPAARCEAAANAVATALDARDLAGAFAAGTANG